MLAALSLSVFAQTPPATPPAAAQPAAAGGGRLAVAKPSGEVYTGKVAWYGRKFAGRRTASGERYDPDALTMAHKTLPFGTRVRVTNLANNQSVVLRVNDRGPAQVDRIGDVSEAAAKRLDMIRDGVVEASIEVVEDAPPKKP